MINKEKDDIQTWLISGYGYDSKKHKKVIIFSLLPLVGGIFFFYVFRFINPFFAKKYEWLFEKFSIIGMIIWVGSLVWIYIKNYLRRSTKLFIDKKRLWYANKSIDLSKADITFGKYGTDIMGAGLYGSILYITEGIEVIRIAIPNYSSSNPNYYTKDCILEADCFMDKNYIESFLSAIKEINNKYLSDSYVKTQTKIETIHQPFSFNNDETVIELRGGKRIWIKVVLLFLASMTVPNMIYISIPSIEFLLLNKVGAIISIVINLSGLFLFIYILYKKMNLISNNYFIVIKNDLVKFLDVNSKKEIFSTYINDITSSIYIIELRSKGMGVYYLTMKLKILGFKNMTIGQPSIINIWTNRNLKKKFWVVLSHPNYIIDADSWDRLAKALKIY